MNRFILYKAFILSVLFGFPGFLQLHETNKKTSLLNKIENNNKKLNYQKDSETLIETIYLSFDDGPTRASRYLDSMTRSDSIKINVFLIGQNVFACKEAENTYKLRFLFPVGTGIIHPESKSCPKPAF